MKNLPTPREGLVVTRLSSLTKEWSGFVEHENARGYYGIQQDGIGVGVIALVPCEDTEGILVLEYWVHAFEDATMSAAVCAIVQEFESAPEVKHLVVCAKESGDQFAFYPAGFGLTGQTAQGPWLSLKC